MNKYDILVFTVRDTNTHYANELRRTMISDVATLAIDTINIEINDSILHDEMIAHRLGLVVIKSDILTNTEITLDVSCEDDYLNITSDMLIFNNNEIKALPNIIIVKLYKGERIKLTAIARKGTGRKHAKWSPVAAIKYNVKYINDNMLEIILGIESNGSLKPSEILEQAKLLISSRKNNVELDMNINSVPNLTPTLTSNLTKLNIFKEGWVKMMEIKTNF